MLSVLGRIDHRVVTKMTQVVPALAGLVDLEGERGLAGQDVVHAASAYATSANLQMPAYSSGIGKVMDATAGTSWTRIGHTGEGKYA